MDHFPKVTQGQEALGFGQCSKVEKTVPHHWLSNLKELSKITPRFLTECRILEAKGT